MITSNDRSLSKDSTIYTYRLLQRIHHHRLYQYMFWLLTLIGWIFALIQINPLPFGLIVLGMPILHTVFLRFLFRVIEHQAPKGWRWSFRMPWFGFVPGSYVALSKVQRLHTQLFWIFLLAFACLFPWIPFKVWLFAAFSHVWLLLPRMSILMLLRKHRKVGFLKVSDQDTSCYAQ